MSTAILTRRKIISSTTTNNKLLLFCVGDGNGTTEIATNSLERSIISYDPGFISYDEDTGIFTILISGSVVIRPFARGTYSSTGSSRTVTMKLYINDTAEETISNINQSLASYTPASYTFNVSANDTIKLTGKISSGNVNYEMGMIIELP